MGKTDAKYARKIVTTERSETGCDNHKPCVLLFISEDDNVTYVMDGKHRTRKDKPTYLDENTDNGYAECERVEKGW